MKRWDGRLAAAISNRSKRIGTQKGPSDAQHEPHKPGRRHQKRVGFDLYYAMLEPSLPPPRLFTSSPRPTTPSSPPTKNKSCPSPASLALSVSSNYGLRLEA